jgi:RHS repeat-associated protein
VAARTSAGQVDYLTGNQQGTDTLAINSATLAVTRRYYDPYGNLAGAPPSSWPGTKGFVGGTADPATGLTNLGAREYDPVAGAFISPDPLITPYNPQDLNAYAYAQDNPSTHADPSGQLLPGGAECGGRGDPCNNSGGGHHHSGDGNRYGGPGTDTAEYPIGEDWVPTVAHCSYACGPPPVKVIPPTVRIITPRQASTGIPDCGLNIRYDPGLCTAAAVAHGSLGNPVRATSGGLGWLHPVGSWVVQHRQPIELAAIGVAAVVAGAACVATVICAAGAGVIVGSAAIGGTASVLDYQVSSGPHTRRGVVDSLGLGVFSGALGGAFGGAADGLGLRFAASAVSSMGFSAAFGAEYYSRSTPSYDQTVTGDLRALTFGALQGWPFDPHG